MIPQRAVNENLEIVLEGARHLGITLARGHAEQMIRYMETLLLWAPRVNLTALRDPREIAVFHFLDSLTVFKVVPMSSGYRVLDVGSGAGFPGMVMQIADDSLKVTLLDRNPRKIVFLKHVARELGLRGVSFVSRRLEDFTDGRNLPVFDLVVSRALSSEPSFFEGLHVLLRSRGFLVRMAGPASSSSDLRLDHFDLETVWEGELPFSDSFRRVCLYRRTD